MKQLEEFKVVGPHEGTKPRKIVVGLGGARDDGARAWVRIEGAQQDLFASGEYVTRIVDREPGCAGRSRSRLFFALG